MIRILSTTTLFFATTVLLFSDTGIADTIQGNLYYDDADGQNVGGQFTDTEFDYVLTLTSAEGIVFDATFRLTATQAGNQANLRTNGGTQDREFGVRNIEGGDNSAIESDESISAALMDVTITDLNGNDPADVTVTFDGFTNVILYFVGNDGDSAAVLDGMNNLIFEFNGSLDPAENGGMPDVNDPALFEFGVTGEGSVGTAINNARVDVSGLMPQTLVVMGTQYSGMGTPADPNRIRVDDLGIQFTVEVEGGKLLLGDINCDGLVNLLDVAPFVDLITTGQFEPKADINMDGFVNLLDVGPFVDLLTGG